ncbi:MAG: ABC transporter permease, partial [Anaerolineae bacterium]
MLIILAICLSAPWTAPYPYDQQFRDIGLTAGGKPVAPNAKFILGTDGLGRDLFSRILWGGRVSLAVGFSASLIACLVGLIVGSIGGFAGGAIDFGIMRFVDLMMSVPRFLLMLMLVVILKPGIWVVVFVISLFDWTGPARLFRSQVVSIKQQDYILAARAVGVPSRRILFHHVLPHLLPLLIVYMTLTIPSTIFAETGLSFLGLGVPPPRPSWGSIMQSGIQFYRVAPWISISPGIAIMITIISLRLVGDTLREAMDPTRKGK